MSNGLKLGLRQDLRIEQRIGVYLAPLMTPVLRRVPAPPSGLEPVAGRPGDGGGGGGGDPGDDGAAPWRRPAPRRR